MGGTPCRQAAFLGQFFRFPNAAVLFREGSPELGSLWPPLPTDESGRQPLPPAKRRRLQLMFEHGNKVAAQGQFDYATQMYSDCVLGDPANPVYVKSFLNNLAKKYQGNKKGSKMAGMATMGSRASLKKTSMQKDWSGVLTNALEILKSNPWDTGALIELGKACEGKSWTNRRSSSCAWRRTPT